jgi:GT2 family glycosyltransferase
MTGPSNPLASVIIPTHNRKDSLRDTLAALYAQTCADRLEVLVMDDASRDGTGEVVAAEFPGVRYERSDTNEGPTVKRNRGARLATADYLFTIDDDCILVNAGTIEQTLALFDQPRVGAVTIPFRNVLKEDNRLMYAAPDNKACYVTSMFYGGMVAFRRDVYLRVGGYREFYFMHVEEPDLAIRLMREGYVVRMGIADPIHHMESPKRNYVRLHALGPRNHLLYSWYNVPAPDVFWQMPATAALTLLHTVRVGYPWLGTKSVVRGLVDSLRVWGARRPVSREVYRLSRELKRRDAVPLAEVEPRLPPLQSIAAAPAGG